MTKARRVVPVRRFQFAIVAAAATLVLGGCHGELAGNVRPVADGMQPQRDTALAAADWSQAESVTIQLLDYGYRPRELRLKAGKPYRLTLVNTGSVSHYFVAPEFFAAVATRKAEVPHVAEFKASVFTSFEVYPRGGTLDFYFVPLVKGKYRAHCHIKDHLPLKIEADLIVE